MTNSNDELRCARCGKSYEKAASLKRHGYYCRSRPLGPPKSKKRCCESCTKSKIRCDGLLPACTSCASRGVVCEYGLNALSNLAEAAKASSDDSAMGDVNENPGSAFAANEDTMLAVHGSKGYDNVLNFGEFGENFVTNTAYELPFANFDAMKMPLNPFFSELADQMTDMMQRSISPMSLHWKAPKVMFQRSTQSAEAQMAAMMLGQIICSFPSMMTQRETFPPFIHTKFYSCAPDSETMPNILKDCMGLAQMFVSRTKESSGVFWRAVRMEQEKLLSQYESHSNAELQAAVQAILIYTSMRLMDDSPDYDCIEMPLLHALNMISSHLSIRIGGDEFKGALRHDDQYWQQFLFQETRRRVVCVARIMNTAFCMDPALSCQALEGFALVPLPANKPLWNATEQQAWRAEFDKCMKERAIHGLTNTGKLVRLHQTALGVESWEVGWQKWYASQDQFGIMVMLTSKLVGQ